MHCLIILVLASAAYAQHFVPQDLPEVVAARNAHLAEVAKAAARVGVLNYPILPQTFAAPRQTFTVPVQTFAAPVQTLTVPVQTFAAPAQPFAAPAPPSDTPEVAVARARHLAEHARQSGIASPASVPTFRELFPRSF